MAYQKFTGEEFIDTELTSKLNDNFDAVRSGNAGTVFPTENLVIGMKFFDTSSNKEYTLVNLNPIEWREIACTSAKYLNITNFIPSNSDFNDYKTPGEYQVQSNIEANTIANLPTSYNDATPRGGVLSVLIGFNAPRTSLVQIYRTYGSSHVVSRTYQRCFYHENSSWTAWREIACTDEVGLLNQANTYTALNIFRANIAVSNGTAAGSQGQVIFGVKPSTATVQANIIASTTGALNYTATESTGHYFKIGNNTASTSITTNESETAILSHNAFEFARITNVGVAKWLGNANTATKLATARAITANLASSTAGSFDGSANITVGVTGTLPIANGGTGATTAAAARTALGCAPAYTYSTTDLTAGSSALTTGTLYIVYE